MALMNFIFLLPCHILNLIIPCMRDKVYFYLIWMYSVNIQAWKHENEKVQEKLL